MHRVEVEAEAFVRRPSEHRLMDEIVASLDRHGFALIEPYYVREVDGLLRGGFMKWLQMAAKKYDWEVIQEVDTFALKIIRKRRSIEP